MYKYMYKTLIQNCWCNMPKRLCFREPKKGCEMAFFPIDYSLTSLLMSHLDILEKMSV